MVTIAEGHPRERRAAVKAHPETPHIGNLSGIRTGAFWYTIREPHDSQTDLSYADARLTCYGRVGRIQLLKRLLADSPV